MTAPENPPTTSRLVSRRGLAKALAFVLPASAVTALAGESPAAATTISSWSLHGNRGRSHRLGTLDKEPLLLFTAGHERARIDSTGRFGIGTHKPEARLEVIATGKDAAAIIGVLSDGHNPLAGAVSGLAFGSGSKAAGVTGYGEGHGPGVLAVGHKTGVEANGGDFGIVATANNSGGTGIKGSSDFGGPGVVGLSDTGAGVSGTASDDTGVGVLGTGNLTGVSGSATTQGSTSVGVKGSVVDRGFGVSGTAFQGYGVHGQAGDSGAGVGGSATGTGFGVYGIAPATGLAAFFNGNTQTTGTATHNAVLISTDHPLMPATHDLQHAAVTAPATTSTYTGRATLGPDGSAQVALPGYVAELDAAPQVQLTGVGPDRVWLSAAATGAGFTIRGAAGQLVYWHVVATHHNATPFETAPQRVRRAAPNPH